MCKTCTLLDTPFQPSSAATKCQSSTAENSPKRSWISRSDSSRKIQLVVRRRSPFTKCTRPAGGGVGLPGGGAGAARGGLLRVVASGRGGGGREGAGGRGRGGGGAAEAPAPGSRLLAPPILPAPDISQMSPEERATRLYN